MPAPISLDQMRSVVRPLLDVWRHQVVAYLRIKHVNALRDPANADLRYARLLANAVDLNRVPRPLDGVLAHVCPGTPTATRPRT